MGIRAEESLKRASRPRISDFNKQVHYKPIFNWKEWAVWEFIEKYKLPYPKLYDKGLNRIGCTICPYRKSSFLENNSTAKAYKNACRDWFENYRSDTHKQRFPQESFESWWRWYTTF